MNSPGNLVAGPDVPAVILDPGGEALGLRIEANGERFAVFPRGIPVWFVSVSMAIPVLAASGALIWWIVSEHITPLLLIGIPAFIAMGAAGEFLVQLSQKVSLSKGLFCQLDRHTRVLHLSRIGVELRDEDIIGFVLVSAWVGWADRYGSDYGRLHELSVLARSEAGATVRYPVVTCQYHRDAAQVGRILADVFHVDLQFRKATWTQRLNLAA